jgi:class 3 adenylate cyclase
MAAQFSWLGSHPLDGSGQELQTTADGFVITFDRPARAVRGAAAMIDASTGQGLTARAGFHVGDVEPAPLRSAKPAARMALTGSPLIWPPSWN